MAVYSTLQAYLAAIDAAIPRDASPLQDEDITEWDDIRQMLADTHETLLDAATMRAVVLAANVIVASMIAENAVTHRAIAANAVESDNLQTTGAGSVGPAVRDSMTGLAADDKPQAPDLLRAASITAALLDAIAARRLPPDPNGGTNGRIIALEGDGWVIAELTGAVYNAATNSYTLPTSGGTPPPATHTRYAFWLPYQDTTPTVAEITAGAATTSGTVTIPAYPSGVPSGQGTRLAFGQLATENDLTTIEQQGSPFGNEFSDFTKGTVGTYEYWISDDDRLPVTAGTTWVVS